MNIFQIKHTYSCVSQQKFIQSNMSYIEMWNYIKMLQCISWDIDSSHGWYEDDTVDIMCKFFGAELIDPNWDVLDEEGYYDIDLYDNWESGYLDDDEGYIPRNKTNDMIKKYNIYRPGLYSAMLKRFLEQHRFGEGDVGAWESIFMDNEVWAVLFQEGIYAKDKFIAEQNARPEYIEKCNWENQRREREKNE